MKYSKRIKRRKTKNNKKCIGYYIIIFIIIIIMVFLMIFSFKTNSFFTKIKSKIFMKKNKNKYIIYNKKEIIDDYLFSIPPKFEPHAKGERKVLEKYLNLTDITLEKNETYILERKEQLLKHFTSLSGGKNFPDVKLYVLDILRFGNNMVMFNNLIYYCEILGLKNIYLNSKNNWYIKDKIVGKYINITMMNPKDVNCNSKDIVCFKFYSGPGCFLLYQTVIKPQVRLYVVKDEIKRNLPHVEIDPDDLYIHIRSGDIFRIPVPNGYAQPPLCFYQTIINNFKFKNIYIITENKNNPLIDILLKNYTNIFYNPKSLSYDIGYLTHAYNLVASVSSFFLSVAKLNDNIKKYFEYDIYRKSEKFIHLHHDFYYFPMKFTRYRMKPSTTYKNEMFAFNSQPLQIKLMKEEICIHKFVIIGPNV